MNIFDTDPVRTAKWVSDDLKRKIELTPQLNGFDVELKNNVIVVVAASGATLDITCHGPTSFGLEDDKRRPRSGMIATMRAFAPNMHFDRDRMVDAVNSWLNQQRGSA